MAKEFAEEGIGFVFVYTREAHPGENYPHHESLDQKLRHAREMASMWDIERPMLVDDLQGTVHRAYGALPNMSWVISRGGSILYRANWTDARTIRFAVEQVLYERDGRRKGERLTPYYLEWAPQRVNALEPFMEGLLTAGTKAVEEFIAAAAEVRGEAAARPMREWWERRQQEL